MTAALAIVSTVLALALWLDFTTWRNPPAYVIRLRCWWADTRMIWRARRDERRRLRAWRAASEALRTDYQRAADRENAALRKLIVGGVVIVALVAAVILAGCGGVYPFEPAPDAGADTGLSPLPDCAVVYPGLVLIAHDCDDPLHPSCEQCSAEDASGNFVTTVAQCHPFGRVTDVCAARCGECP